tara:strand:- start:4468 stop:5229 length:762 start_codon:yes stop_codon:yes gene_type:complete
MKKQIPDINKRFLQVMEENDYSGYKFAKEFKEVSESKLTHIRSGRNQPSTDLISALIKKFPNISYNWLLAGEGEMLKDGIVKEPELKYNTEELKNSNGNTFTENEDGTYTIKVPFVPFDAYASYLEIIESEVSKIQDWEKVSFNVEKYALGNYLGFKTKGDSMNGGLIDDTPDKALILGRELGRQHWLDGFNATKHGWIIISKYNIMHKDIIGLNKENGTIKCHSRNPSPEFSDFDLKLNDVYQIFKVIKRTF